MRKMKVVFHVEDWDTKEVVIEKQQHLLEFTDEQVADGARVSGLTAEIEPNYIVDTPSPRGSVPVTGQPCLLVKTSTCSRYGIGSYDYHTLSTWHPTPQASLAQRAACHSDRGAHNRPRSRCCRLSPSMPVTGKLCRFDGYNYPDEADHGLRRFLLTDSSDSIFLQFKRGTLLAVAKPTLFEGACHADH